MAHGLTHGARHDAFEVEVREGLEPGCLGQLQPGFVDQEGPATPNQTRGRRASGDGRRYRRRPVGSRRRRQYRAQALPLRVVRARPSLETLPKPSTIRR